VNASDHVPVDDGEAAPLVSIVIVTYNNVSFVAECISCVLAQTHAAIELVVVDQASVDGTVALVQLQFATVRLLENPSNTGFAAGMNRGIAATRGEYLLLLNSDVFLEQTFVSRAVTRLGRQSPEERVGMFAGLVYGHRRGERTSQIDGGGFLITPYHTSYHPAVDSHDAAEAEAWVAGPSGCAMFFSRALLEEVRLPQGDYFDERYFCYGEDIDLMFRAQLMGWRCLFAPVVVGWHIGGASTNRQRELSRKRKEFEVHALRNRYLTLLSCYPLGLLLWTSPWQLVVEFGQMALWVLGGRWQMLRCLLRAQGEVLRLLPDMLAKRRWIQARRRVSTSYLRSLFVNWGVVRTFESLWLKARASIG
jgi:GT2 family glycosyltransferase